MRQIKCDGSDGEAEEFNPAEFNLNTRLLAAEREPDNIGGGLGLGVTFEDDEFERASGGDQFAQSMPLPVAIVAN